MLSVTHKLKKCPACRTDYKSLEDMNNLGAQDSTDTEVVASDNAFSALDG